MKLPASSRRLIASLLGVALLSCSTTPPGAEGVEEVDLARSVLLIQELPDGRVIHTWQRADEFDLSRYKHFAQAQRSSPRIVLAASWRRNCDQENDDCVDKCRDRPLPSGHEHITPGGAKAAYCRDQCRQAYKDCVDLEKLTSQKFTEVDNAIDWLKRNRNAVLAGTVIVIAGVAFIVLSAGAGLVILAPAILLTMPSSEPHLHIAGGSS